MSPCKGMNWVPTEFWQAILGKGVMSFSLLQSSQHSRSLFQWGSCVPDQDSSSSLQLASPCCVYIICTRDLQPNFSVASESLNLKCLIWFTHMVAMQSKCFYHGPRIGFLVCGLVVRAFVAVRVWVGGPLPSPRERAEAEGQKERARDRI